MILNLPNLLTLIRILLIIPILFLLNTENYSYALFLTIMAFITDCFDGNIARRSNQITKLGSLLDPVADKLIVLSCISYFVVYQDFSITYFILIALKDLTQVIAILLLFSRKKTQFKVKPRFLAKISTAIKFLILILLFTNNCSSNICTDILNMVLIFSGSLEMYILYKYIQRFTLIHRGEHDTFE